MRQIYLRIVTFLLMILGLMPADGIYAATPRYFAETQHTLADPMLTFWNQHGGLPVFGFPISEAFDEPNRDTGQTYRTQYLERNRFEAHPENPAPYDVLLGRLGVEALRQQGRDWQTFPKADPDAPHYFTQTGHAITHGPFWSYFQAHGLEFDGQRGTSLAESIALFGYPISEPQQETNSSGDTVLIQWFERARFEDHGAKGVLLGLLGNETTAGRRAEAPFQPVAGSPPPPTNPTNQAVARHLFDLVNELRRQNGMTDLVYRDDLQGTADRIAHDWHSAFTTDGDDAAVFAAAQAELNAMTPWAGLTGAIANVPLENKCNPAYPEDPVKGGLDPIPAMEQYRDIRSLTIGVYGPYPGVCHRPSVTVVYVIGQ